MDNIRLRVAFDEAHKYKSLRSMAEEIGVSASTLSRYANRIGTIDAETLARLSVYLEVPISPGTVTAYGENTFQAIESVIFSDKSLTLEARSGLVDLMDVAYRTLLRHQQEEIACQ